MSKADPNYRFRDQVLTRRVFAELIVDLFAGQVVENQTLRLRIPEHHSMNGGKPATGDLNQLTIRALADLRADDKAAKVAKGQNRIFEAQVKRAPTVKVSDKAERLKSEKTVGDGKHSVYVYYYPVYRLYAETKGEEIYTVKVGRAEEQTAASRVDSDVSRTAVPERPVLALVIKTDRALRLETYIHERLRALGRNLNEVYGKEWFVSSPEEVERIYREMFEEIKPPRTD
jgi:hypothetical protein